MNLSACVHFVRDEGDDDYILEIAEELKTRDIACAYVDYDAVRNSGDHFVDHIGKLLGLEHAPYLGPYCVPAPWIPFWDDLMFLSERANGVVIIIDNADVLFAEARNDAFDLIESFLMQFDKWFEKKPCHLCFQMEKNSLVRQAFQPKPQLRVVR